MNTIARLPVLTSRSVGSRASPGWSQTQTRRPGPNSCREATHLSRAFLMQATTGMRSGCLGLQYSTILRNGNRRNANHLDESLSFSQKNGNSLTWVLVVLTVCFTYPILYKVSAESRAGEWGLLVIDNEKSWSLRADARRRITLYYQIQVSPQGTGSEHLGLGPSFPLTLT